MLKRIAILSALLFTAISWQETCAEIIQVDFTAELVGNDPELNGIDTTIEGAYRFDDVPYASDENFFGELLVTELYKFELKLFDKDYQFANGAVYYFHKQHSSYDLSVYHGIKVGEVTFDHGLKIADTVPGDVLLGIQDYIALQTPNYGTQYGPLTYVGNYGSVEEVETKDGEVPFIHDDISGSDPTFYMILGDQDGNGSVDDDEIIATFRKVGDISEATYFFQTIPDVLYPSVEIDFNSVFSVLYSEETLAPISTFNRDEPAIVELNFYKAVEVDGELTLQASTAEYQVTTLTSVVVVPEPTSMMIFGLGLIALPRRGSAL